VRWCFADVVDAAAFAGSFGGTRIEPEAPNDRHAAALKDQGRRGNNVERSAP
jgi:hypothetical protein